MVSTRGRKASLNIIASLVSQLISLFCGFIVPSVIIRSFGSEAYGATSSIAQFLAYISLVEGGIGGVARAALYKPLAENDMYGISKVVAEIKRFFRIIAYIFIIYVALLAITYKFISNIQCFDWITTALLVVVISISTFAQYFIGISYAVLLQSAQKTYITQVFSIITVVLNTVLILILVYFGCSLVIVKLVSSCVFVLKPVSQWIYVKKNYQLVEVKEKNSELLKQKWTGLGQHIAYFLHSNTDIAVLTVLANLSTVAIYSVHYMVTSHIQNITTSFSAGMEALFGDMLAKRETSKVQVVFSYYETLISFVSIFLFSVTAVMIVPFVDVYTSGITDVNYNQPLFAFLLVVTSTIYCLRLPYHAMTIAAGHFKQTKVAAYGEAAINIFLSLILVIKLGLVGVAIGTVTAATFRFVFYVYYLSKNICYRKPWLCIKRELINGFTFFSVIWIGKIICNIIIIRNFFQWVLVAIIVSAISLFTINVVNYLFYKDDLRSIIKKFNNRLKHKV